MYSNYLLYTCISERHPTCRIAKINTSQMQSPPPPQMLNLVLVLAINKHLKVHLKTHQLMLQNLEMVAKILKLDIDGSRYDIITGQTQHRHFPELPL